MSERVNVTRSHRTLDQNIQAYELQPTRRKQTTGTISETMAPPENEETAAAGNSTNQASLEMIAQMCNAFHVSQDNLQRFMRDNMANTDHNKKLDDCPIRNKDSSLESWLEEVEMWDRINDMKDSKGFARKYQKVMESIRKSEDAS